MRRASFVRARCEPHTFAHPVYAARFRASDIVALCAFPTPKRNGKRQRPRNGIAGVSSKSRSLRSLAACGLSGFACFAALLSRPACLHVLQPLFCLAACLHALPDNFAPLCLAASLRLNCSRVVVVTLAGPRCWRFSPTPTAREVRLIRSPSPCSKERRGITVTDSRGLSPHSSNLERLVTLPRTRRLSSIFGCVGYSMASSQGGGQALCGDSAPFVTPPLSWQPSVICFALLTALSLTNAAFRQLAAHPGKTAPPFPC